MSGDGSPVLCWIQKCPEEGWAACWCPASSGELIPGSPGQMQVTICTFALAAAACCYFCLCCWHRGGSALFPGSCLCLLSPAQAQLRAQRRLLPACGWTQSSQAGAERCATCANWSFVQELLLLHCWVCPRSCWFVLEEEEARSASSSAFAFAWEPEMLLRSWWWLLISHNSFSCNTDALLGTHRPKPYFSWFTVSLNHRMTWV